MNKAGRLVLIIIAMVVALSGGVAQPGATRVAAQDGDITSAALVSGQWRVKVLQTVDAPEVPAAKLGADGGPYVVAITDVTNTGVASLFDPAILQLGTTSGSPLDLTEPVVGNTTASVEATQALALTGVSAEGTFPAPENGTIRLAVVFNLDTAGADPVVRVNEQVMSIANTVVDKLTVSSLPAVVPTMALDVADLKAAVGGGEITVTLRGSGAEQTFDIDGLDAPKADANIRSSCYAGETATQTTNLIGNTVWLETVPETGEQLVWFNDPATGTFGLLNSQLIAGGFAGVDDDPTPYASWLGAVEQTARNGETGLWAECQNAQGKWINQPQPTPVPTQTAEQIRAEYQWIDYRDLVIRPGNFDGEKIAVEGTVFNMEVDGNFTFLQIWLSGSYDAAVVVYQGDTTGLYPDMWVTVYGEGDGTFEGTNAYGGTIIQPIIRADLIDF